MSEVSSTDTVGEKDQITVTKDSFNDIQISVPKELFHDFESLKNGTNLTTVDLMRKLLLEYQSYQRDGATSDGSQLELKKEHQAFCDSLGMDLTEEQRHLASKERTPSPRLFPQKSLLKSGRKSSLPGQKLRKVCDILHCKRAAKELEQQRKTELGERNCHSVGSNSSGTLGSSEDNFIVQSNLEGNYLDNPSPNVFQRKQDIHVPPAHITGTQDAVFIRKILASRSNLTTPDPNEYCSSYDNSEDGVLDLSVKRRPNDDYCTLNDAANVEYQMEGSIISANAPTMIKSELFAMHEHSPVSVSPRQTPTPTDLNMMYVQQTQPPSLQDSRFISSSMIQSYHSLQQQQQQQRLQQQQQQQQQQQHQQQVFHTTTDVNERPVSRPVSPKIRPRTRRQTPKKTQINEGMKLINENNLYPGVYTSTFKLPGSRRGRRNANAKQTAQSTPDPNNQSSMCAPSQNQQSMMVPVQVPNGANSSYMMLCPQVAVSSVLVKSPRKRGRPPKRPTLTQFQPPMEAGTAHATMPQTQMTFTIPVGGQVGNGAVESGSISLLQNSVNDNKGLVFQQPNQQATNAQISSQMQPNHSQLMSILNQATSINACNPIFVPNSSLQAGIPTALPTNSSGLITLPLQQMNPESHQITLQLPESVAQASSSVNQEMIAENSPLVNTAQQLSAIQSSNSTDVLLDKEQMAKTPYQELILSPKSLVTVKPRSKPTTTELIRSNSNFYCGSFKIRPQKPSAHAGEGAPIKRGRGRPRLNVFESVRQKETSESRSKMYQELFHCKICNEIVPTDERMAHQRKHLGSKSRCETCGVEYQANKSSDLKTSQCLQCRKIFGCELKMTPEISDVEDPVDSTSTSNLSSQYYCCGVCGQSCSSQEELALHINLHQEETVTSGEDSSSDVYPYEDEPTENNTRHHKCPYDGCEKTFLKNFHLQEHIRVKHFNIKAFKCNWPDCNKEFAGIRHLKVHMLIHKNEKPLKCSFCDYRCRQRNALNWHMRKHPEAVLDNEDLMDTDSDCDEPSMVGDISPNDQHMPVETMDSESDMIYDHVVMNENGEKDSENMNEEFFY